MKKYFSLPLLFFIAWLFTGYYNSIEDAEIHSHFFIKKSPTLQIKFTNIYANNADPKRLAELDTQQRQLVIDYCKYRLGIEVQLNTDNELEACQAR
ncbi:hypothetical protein [Pseudomonas cichorii]|uniref:hypothetical protein n=1 Tax=Pseudomonas cichorii TaxID=36746 RepID=UPI001C8A8AD3|nr:hypothetical protein [Pseudomonas cichorii]MBX8485129.1 hypothetical protein [Pseudomonas cichorii]MBX8516976.1 hypothetical protein [Pseudomonas cichorii]MBX8528219.1 hypothetical protein [Pseudomonas cichorii]MBX8574751.1 hypothetical protein [Pseudomonas cichorii]